MGIKFHNLNLRIADKRQKMAKEQLIMKHEGCVEIIN